MPLLVRPEKAGRIALNDSYFDHEIAATLADAFGNNYSTIAMDGYRFPSSAGNLDAEKTARILAVKRPNQLRSVHAKFDPRNAESADLIAAGHPLLPWLPREDRKRTP